MLEANSVTGSAKAVLEFCKSAMRMQCDLSRFETSIMIFRRNDGENSLTSAIRGLRVPLHIVTERRRFDPQVIPQLRELINHQPIDLIWSNSVKSHFLVRWAGLNRSCAWVAFHHGYTNTDVKTRFYNELDRWSLKAADRVITSSASFVNELELRGVCSHRIHVQHMSIGPAAFVSEERKQRLRSLLGISAETRVLLSVGRLSREKGHVDLIRAFPKLRELATPIPLRLVIVGEGPERPKIEKLCRALALESAVTMAGQQDDPAPYYAIADVFMLPSHSEGSPNVLLEAMAHGVPIIATSVGGIPEVVTDEEDGLLVEQDDGYSMATAAVQLLKDKFKRDRLVSSARGKLMTRTPARYFQSIASVFRSAVGDTR